MQEAGGEEMEQMTNDKPPGLRPRRARGGRDRRSGRDKGAEEFTDGTGDGPEAAGVQMSPFEFMQPLHSRCSSHGH